MSEHDQTSHDLIAAYLSGAASADELARFEHAMATDPEFKALFEKFETAHIDKLTEIDPVAPPADLIDKIMDEIEASDEAPTHAPELIIEERRTPPRKSQGPEPWRTVSVISTLAAAAAIGFHLVPASSIEPQVTPSPLVALLSGDEAPSLMVVVYDIEAQSVLARFTNTSLPQDSVWQLWLVRDGIETPISLGLLDTQSATGALSVTIDQELQSGTDILAVSVEPIGGSTQPGPSGPVVFTGTVQPL